MTPHAGTGWEAAQEQEQAGECVCVCGGGVHVRPRKVPSGEGRQVTFLIYDQEVTGTFQGLT